MDDIEYQRQIIDTFINAIYVYDDKLVFTYTFKDGTETVPLKAVEDAFGSDLTQVAPPNPRNPNIIPIGDGFGFFLFISSIVARSTPKGFPNIYGVCLARRPLKTFGQKYVVFLEISGLSA